MPGTNYDLHLEVQGNPTAQLTVEADVGEEVSAHRAEAWAVGQRGGVDVPETDPTWNNNSKYYAQQAAGSATAAGNAQTAAETAQGEAEAAAGHYPYIDGTSKHWLVWDVQAGRYTDTGVVAEGEDGAQGPAGQDGYSPTATVTKSGKVATITITDKNGTTSKSVSDGEDGQDGYSPTATVTKSGKIATITITDKNGTTTKTVSDGEDGQDGAPGQDGQDGQDGYTPVRGTDYWTAADKAEMVAETIAQLGFESALNRIGLCTYNGQFYINPDGNNVRTA
jgi:hypothetical protein